MRNSPNTGGKFGTWKALVFLVALSLGLSLLIAGAVSTFVPVQAGTVELPRDYRSYSKQELREVLSADLPQPAGLADVLRDRGTLLQAIVWVLAVSLVRLQAMSVFLGALCGLSLGLLVGLFSATQFLVLLASVIGTLALKALFARSSMERQGGI